MSGRTRGAPALLALVALLIPTTLSAQAADGEGGAAPPAAAARQAGAPSALDPDLEARTSALAAEIRCPVCRGLSIEDSPTDLAVEMKALVRERLAGGETPEEIKAYFVSRYGEWVLLRPTGNGLNMGLWLAPVALLLGAGAVLGLAFRRWTSLPVEDAPNVPVS